MERRKFSRKFKLEAVKLVSERGVAVARAACDLDLHMNAAQVGPGAGCRSAIGIASTTTNSSLVDSHLVNINLSRASGRRSNCVSG
jgi:hypothetical protein